MTMFLITLLSLVSVIHTLETDISVETEFLNHQDSLHSFLFKDYNSDLSAVYSLYSSPFVNSTRGQPRKPFGISISLCYLKLIQVTEPEEKVDVLMEYFITWTDQRLRWDPTKFGGIDRLFVSRDTIWRPAVLTINGISSDETSESTKRLLIIYYNGTVLADELTYTTLACSMNVQKFPFDVQSCFIRLICFLYTIEEMTIDTKIDTFNLVADMGNGEWQMTSLTKPKISTALAKSSNPLANFDFKLKRNPVFYVTMIVIPSFVINVLSIIGIFMETGDDMSKLTIGLTNIMSMTFILGILSEEIPKTKNLPLLAVYVIVNLCIMTFAVLAMLIYPRCMLLTVIKKKESKTDKMKPKLALYSMIYNRLNVKNIMMILLHIANIANFIALLV